MSASRVSYIPSTILTTSTSALAGSNGAVTFLNVPRDGQPSTLSSTGSFKMALPRSSTSGQGSQLTSININYSIEDNNITSVTLSLSTQSFGPASTITPIATTPSGFTLTPGNYSGVVTINTPAYANGSVPEYFLLDVTVVVATSAITELRVNDIELVYQENVANSLPSNLNLPGYLNVGSAGPPTNSTAGDISGVRLSIGTPQYTLGTPNTVGILTSSGQVANIVQTYSPLSAPTANSLNGLVMGVSFQPASNSSAVLAGNHLITIIAPPTPVNCSNTIYGGVARISLESAGNTYAALIGLLGSNRVVEDGPSTLTSSVGIQARGLEADTTSDFTSTVGSITGVLVQGARFQQSTVCTVTAITGVGISASTITGTTTVVTNRGINIVEQDIVATTSSAIELTGAQNAVNNYGIWFNTNATGTGRGIVFGTAADTSFWRGAAGQLLTTTDWLTRHYLCSSVPTVAAGAGAGTGPTISITGTDHGFRVNLTTGTTATTSATLFTVTWGATWTASAPEVTWSGGNSASEALAVGARPIITAISTTTMTFTSGGTALADSTAYIFRFTAMR